jgi:hypothetical protein
MATRMQQRKGTAAQWISTNAGDGPILNAGEIGYESDTNKFKIGDGVNHWVDLNYFLDSEDVGGAITGYILSTDKGVLNGVAALDANVNVLTTTGVVFEGSSADAHETTLTVTNPTADRTITLPDATGTVAFTTDITVSASSTNTFSNKSISLGSNTVTATLAELNTAISDADVATIAGVETLTNKTLTSPKINEDVAITATATELNYVDGVTSAIQTQLNALAPKADPTFTGTVSAAALTLSGDLTVNGTTTTINSTTLAVDDKNIVLGDVATPSDATADGGGITLKGATDKTFNWVDATDAWTSSEHINLASGKTLKYNGTDLVASQSGNSGKYLTTDGTSTSWGTVSGYSAPTLGSTSIASGATVTTVAGLTLTTATITTPTLSLSATSNTGAGRISFDSTADKIYVGDGTTAIEFAGSTIVTNAQVASYTTVLADKDKLVEISNASANTLTIPTNASVAYPIGTVINVLQTSTGQTTITPAGGVTINASPGLKLRAQWSGASIIKRAENTWVAMGDLTA